MLYGLIALEYFGAWVLVYSESGTFSNLPAVLRVIVVIRLFVLPNYKMFILKPFVFGFL